jgi:hypothetical protein
VGGVALAFTGFGSYQSRDLSQYELLDRTVCKDSKPSRYVPTNTEACSPTHCT